MPIATPAPASPDAARSRKLNTPLLRLVLPLCIIFIGAAVLGINYRQPPAANAAAAVAPAQLPPEPAGPAPASAPATKNRDKLAATPSIWPAQGTVTSGFGWRISPLGDGNELHQGIDIAYAMGAPVVATADGQVIQSGWSGGYGNMVRIDHGNGLATLYGHNSELAVGVGQTVKKGEIIAFAGSTGKSTGPHVHYEIRAGDTPVDPWKYLVLY